MKSYHIISQFPELVNSWSECGMIQQARKKNILNINIINPRSFTEDKHQSIDDSPFGGADGMLAMPEVYEKILKSFSSKLKTIHFSPRGKVLTQSLAKELALDSEILFICSRYAGLDQRIIDKYVDLEISIGDYILNGGEVAAMATLEAVTRNIEGVLGNEVSLVHESFSDGLLEEPQYTRPQIWNEQRVPEILLSGHHEKIKQWQKAMRIIITAEKRPDMFLKAQLSKEELQQAKDLLISTEMALNKKSLIQQLLNSKINR